ncbi:hypothetical protein [Marinoscillum sp.]|uniref:hypothetical protein n=1 Tax=Marinoscillum sp. TaxID=2024838 RepID=UPI003BAABE8C
MDRDKIKHKAKEKIDDIFNNLDELEASATYITADQKKKWQQEMSNLDKSKDTIKSLYDSLLDATDDSFDHLQKAFDQMAGVMKNRLSAIKEEYKEAVEA